MEIKIIKQKVSRISIAVFFVVLSLILSGCDSADNIPDKSIELDELEFEERVELTYAEQFAIDRYSGGYSVVYVGNGEKYIIVPSGGEIPDNTPAEMKVIAAPTENVYVAATPVMGLFDALESGSAVKFSGTQADDWYIEYAKNALNNGTMLYSGKYNEPDFELLLSNNCELAVENTMIEHSPNIKEKLEELGITVFVDYSSYEPHPLGRCEWIKVYGEMLGKADEAERLFEEQAEKLDGIESISTGKTAVFFYINSSGQIVTRKSGDYITKMIELAGGENALSELGGDGFSTVTVEPEKFYGMAKDAEFIIYNSTVGGEISSVEELVGKYNLLSEFKAVKNGNVWCTRNNLYQETMKLGTVVQDFNSVFSGNTDTVQPTFLYKLD